ncbi:MFS transporter [Aquipseudomonas ullengensis]|uniref:MFS transporter n=1 Tax=Aquipseudomonas ullengensis TaxID=2759166 RepID=A0A7W4LPS9_9GAMM|nr:MFS transporter [Pseudomonas ullengensis]MBB2497140.1 MFS transporter [Pseudomonas ullengensis]
MKPVSKAMLMLALVLAAINLRPGITSLAPLIERIATELALSRGLISLTTALPVLCMGLLAPLAPRLAVRLGLERTIALCLALITLALLLRLGSQASVLLIGSAVLLGAGIAVAGPLLSGFIKRHFRDHVGQVVGWYSFSMAIGGAGGAVLTVPLTQGLGDNWSHGLAAWALPALLALLFWLRLPNRAEHAAQSDAQGLPWREPRAWLVTGFFAIQAGFFYTMATWLVARYHEAGFSLLHSNGLFSLFMLVGLPSAWLMPWLAQRFDIRQPLLVACGACMSVCLGMITFLPQFLPETWAVLMGLALSGSFSLSLVLPLYEVHTPLAVSRWTAMMLCAGYGMACLAPILVGLGRDLAGSYQVPFMVLIGLALLMTVLAWALRSPSEQRVKA